MLSEGTRAALTVPVTAAALPAQQVKGRETPISAYKIARRGCGAAGPDQAGPDGSATNDTTQAGTR